MTERTIQNVIRKAIGNEPDVVLWRNNTGRLPDSRGIPVPFGLAKGSSDLVGIGPGGRFMAIEVKHKSKLTNHQEMFLNLVRRYGGFACVIRASTVEDAKSLAVAALERARKGENQ